MPDNAEVHPVSVTWAIPVEAHLLGDALDTYVETKAKITTVRLCAQNGNPSETPLARLPQEMTDNIVGHVWRDFFEERSQDWLEVNNAFQDWRTVSCDDKDPPVIDQEKVYRFLIEFSMHGPPSTETKRFGKHCKVRTGPYRQL